MAERQGRVLRVTSQGEGFGDPKRRKLNGCRDAVFGALVQAKQYQASRPRNSAVKTITLSRGRRRAAGPLPECHAKRLAFGGLWLDAWERLKAHLKRTLSE